jgi:hypothetical protein
MMEADLAPYFWTKLSAALIPSALPVDEATMTPILATPGPPFKED